MEVLTSEQVSEWEAYDRLDPIGEWREDFRMASLQTTIFNLALQIHGKKGAKLAEVKDFLPEWDSEGKVPKVQTMEEMKAWALNFAQVHNASLNKGISPPKRVPQPHKNFEP